jgi:hypothetical protein
MEICEGVFIFRLRISFCQRSEDVLLRACPKNLGNIHVDVSVDIHEILPPFGRLDDKREKSCSG